MSHPVAAKVAALCAAGLHLRAIARAIARAESTVRYHLRRLGLRAKDGRAVAPERSRAWRLALSDAAADRALLACERAGWPEALAPSHARIMGLLLARGPLTHGELAAAMGYRASGGPLKRQSRPLAAALRAMAVQGVVVRIDAPRPVVGGLVVTYDLAPWLRSRKEQR